MAKKTKSLNEVVAEQPAKEILPASLPEGYASILEAITNKIRAAQTRAMVAVNRELIDVYRDIGKTIHEQQQTAEWGSSVVEQLAKDLKKTFAGMRGFSSRNLWNMRDFYLSCADNQKLQAMTAEISWTKEWGKVTIALGRYPDEGYAINHKCDEMGYVLKGSGRLITEKGEATLGSGDVVYIPHGEKYYWEGNMTVVLPCAPAWYPGQHGTSQKKR